MSVCGFLIGFEQTEVLFEFGSNKKKLNRSQIEKHKKLINSNIWLGLLRSNRLQLNGFCIKIKKKCFKLTLVLVSMRYLTSSFALLDLFSFPSQLFLIVSGSEWILYFGSQFFSNSFKFQSVQIFFSRSNSRSRSFCVWFLGQVKSGRWQMAPICFFIHGYKTAGVAVRGAWGLAFTRHTSTRLLNGKIRLVQSDT